MIPPSSLFVTIIIAVFVLIASMIVLYEVYKKLSTAVRIALFVAAAICFLNWYFIHELWLNVVLTIFSICIVWITHEIEISPVVDEDFNEMNADSKDVVC